MTPTYELRHFGFHPGLGQSSIFDTTHGTASFATSTAGSITAASLAMVGLGPVGAIVGIGTQLVAMIVGQFQGCGQACILETQAANAIENQIKQMFAAYMSSGHTKSEQAAYLQFFDAAMAKLDQYCGQASFGKSGQNCIADRQEGACKWHVAPFGWQNGTYTPAGQDGSGTVCWNWYSGYRDPVANDPTVVPDTPPVTQAVQTISSQFGISLPSNVNYMPLFIALGLILVAVSL